PSSRSCLLPYTTLFRSQRRAEPYVGDAGNLEQPLLHLLGQRASRLTGIAADPDRKVRLTAAQELTQRSRAACLYRHPAVQRRVEDRKSTRLNSSHVKIS